MKKGIFIITFLISTISVISQELEVNYNFVQRYFYRDNIVSIEKFYEMIKNWIALKLIILQVN